jgi:hypothetical protein
MDKYALAKAQRPKENLKKALATWRLCESSRSRPAAKLPLLTKRSPLAKAQRPKENLKKALATSFDRSRFSMKAT